MPLGDLPATFAGHPLVQRLRESRVDPSSANNSGPSTNGTPSTNGIPPTIPTSFGAVQRVPESAPAPPVGPPPAPVQRTEEPTSPVPPNPRPPAAPPRTTDADVDDMFKRLYPRVRDELRWDLRVQRERAGLLADPI